MKDIKHFERRKGKKKQQYECKQYKNLSEDGKKTWVQKKILKWEKIKKFHNKRHFSILAIAYKYMENEIRKNIGLSSKHGTIIQTGITCKKISFYIRDSASRWFIVKKGKIFWSYVKNVWILVVWENVEPWMPYAKKFLNCPTIFLDWHDKTQLVPAFFTCF